MPVFGGGFSVFDPPQRGGTFINFKTRAAAVTRDNALGVVGLVVQADWGPDNSIAELTGVEQASALYGTGQTALFAIESAIKGESLAAAPGQPGRSGARKVLAYRVTGTGPVAATVTLNKTGPVAALTVSGKYKGTLGNSITVTTRTNAVDGTKQDLLVKVSGVQVESYTYTTAGGTALAALTAVVNAASSWVTLAVVSEGTLINVTDSALISGSNGAAVVQADHVTAQGVFEARAGEFSVFAIDDFATLNSTIQGLYRDWIIRINGEGATNHFVIGGAAAEAVSAATQRSGPVASFATAMDSQYIVNLTRDLKIAGTVYSSSKMAPRVAGILAAAGVSRSASWAQFVGATLNNAPTAAEIEILVRGGVVPFLSVDGVARLGRSRTSLVTTTTELDGKIFKSTLRVRKLMETARRLAKLQIDKISGQDDIVNDPIVRGAVLNLFRAEMQRLQNERIAEPGWEVALDATHDNTGGELWLNIVMRPSDGIEVVLINMSIPV